MSLTRLFAKLGAPLKNTRWSWGAVRADGAVFLRVWEDAERKIDDAWFVVIGWPERDGVDDRAGYRERCHHVELIVRDKRPCYLVMCRAEDAAAARRTIASFNADEVFLGGRIVVIEGKTLVERAARIPVEAIALTSS
jgi:hypothetical protein